MNQNAIPCIDFQFQKPGGAFGAERVPAFPDAQSEQRYIFVKVGLQKKEEAEIAVCT
jgi:hypothetical protein